MSRARGRHTRNWTKQVVHVSDPHITSAASLVLLQKHYFSLDKSAYSEWRMRQIRRKWMKEKMKCPDSEGGLTCELCGKKGLLPKTKNPEQLATLDHIKEIGKGGKWNDPSNFQVACANCNSEKNKSLYRT